MCSSSNARAERCRRCAEGGAKVRLNVHHTMRSATRQNLCSSSVVLAVQAKHPQVAKCVNQPVSLWQSSPAGDALQQGTALSQLGPASLREVVLQNSTCLQAGGKNDFCVKMPAGSASPAQGKALICPWRLQAV